MAFNFSGKKFLVTGAGRGIGYGIAVGLANAGAKVYALDCVQDRLDTLASESSNIVTINQDLSNWEETRATLDKLEVLDGLVNDAAVVLGVTPALDHTKEELDKYMSVNLLAYINCIQVVGRKMVEAGKKGSIVNISSFVSLSAFPMMLGYCVAKAGVDMVTKQFALELGPHNIRVNSVNPGLVDTKLRQAVTKLSSSIDNTVNGRMPMGRFASVDEIAGPVMYLLSDLAAMVTGTTHVVDGGIGCNITTIQ